MTGSILQLAAVGIDTIYLTGNPTITHFKIVYRRHTNFTLYPITEKVQDFTKFNSICRYKLPKKGDCISNVYLQFDIGNFNVVYQNPIKKNITKILNDFKILNWNNAFNDNDIITPDIYKTSLKPIIYDNVENYVLYNNFYQRYIDDIKLGIKYYHLNVQNINNQIYKKLNIIYNNSSFYITKNYVYSLLDEVKKYVEKDNYYEKINQTNINLNTITDVSGGTD